MQKGRGRGCPQPLPLNLPTLLPEGSDCCLSSHPEVVDWRAVLQGESHMAQAAPTAPHLRDSIMGKGSLACLVPACAEARAALEGQR